MRRFDSMPGTKECAGTAEKRSGLQAASKRKHPEQLGPLESIESMQMGEKGQSGVYRIDSLMTAKFQKKRAYVYCVVVYRTISGDGFQIAELMPYDFKITNLYVTPLPKEMEKHLGRELHDEASEISKFHDTKLTDLQN